MSEKNGKDSGDIEELYQDLGKPRSICTTRMLERAVREGWPIPAERRKAIVMRQVEAAEGADSNREATSAAACLIEMDKVNLRTMQLLAELQGEKQSGPQVNNQIVLHVPDNGRLTDDSAGA